MSSRILTSCITSIDTFIHDPHSLLRNAEGGVVAVFINNIPAFHAISTQRLAQLLKLESHLTQSRGNLAGNQFYEELLNSQITVPIGKFSMYPGWRPDKDFQRMAALWGIPITQPVTSEEIAAFITYWQAEGKMFHHIQWQQKLARSIQIGRYSNGGGKSNRDINTVSEPDNRIPPGFRG